MPHRFNSRLPKLPLALIFAIALTAGCGAGKTKPQPAPPAPAKPPATQTPPEPETARESPQEEAMSALERNILARAESAFRAGRLTEPAHDNAYDSFHSVLLLNPDNSQARAGVQAIMIRYAELIRRALADHDYHSADILLNRAQIYYPANALLMDLKKELLAAREKEDQQILATAPTDMAIVDYPLPSGALSRRSQTVSEFLARIALRLKENDESVMIHARNDAEGRWIYKQLNDAVPDYRVRGDIKLGRVAKIVILPPLQ